MERNKNRNKPEHTPSLLSGSSSDTLEIDRFFSDLMENDAVRSALKYLEEDQPVRLSEQIKISEIAASPFQESNRARDYKDRLSALGLTEVQIDSEGNVLGRLEGMAQRPNLIVSAHLDTVFPPGYDPSVHTDEDGLLHGPGICDDAAGLSLLLSLIRVFNQPKLRTLGTIWFVGTVGEEGLGDLRGVKHLFASRSNIDGFITIDGAGSNTVGFSALGIKRYEIDFSGTGGHSYGAFGEVGNPIHAMGRAIGAISDIELATDPKTTCSVTVVEGGTSINSIASNALMQVDIRSPEEGLIKNVVEKFRKCIEKAVETENNKCAPDNTPASPITWKERPLGDRPPGKGDSNGIHVQVACAATRALGIDSELRPPGSTDANVPISLGIPSLVLGRGGKDFRTHTLTEAYDPEGAHLAVQRTFLVLIALIGLEGICRGFIESAER